MLLEMRFMPLICLSAAGPDVARRRELGLRAREILLNYANELPGQLQKILVPVKGMLVQDRIIENDAVDLGVLGVSALQNAAKLYEAVVTSLQFNPVNFPKLVTVFKSFTTLTTIADELEQAGQVDTILQKLFK